MSSPVASVDLVMGIACVRKAQHVPNCCVKLILEGILLALLSVLIIKTMTSQTG